MLLLRGKKSAACQGGGGPVSRRRCKGGAGGNGMIRPPCFHNWAPYYFFLPLPLSTRLLENLYIVAVFMKCGSRPLDVNVHLHQLSWQSNRYSLLIYA